MRTGFFGLHYALFLLSLAFTYFFRFLGREKEMFRIAGSFTTTSEMARVVQRNCSNLVQECHVTLTPVSL